MNTLVLLTMPLTPHDDDASANSFKCLKIYVTSHFDPYELTNAVMLLMIPSHDQKKLCCILFQSS